MKKKLILTLALLAVLLCGCSRMNLPDEEMTIPPVSNAAVITEPSEMLPPVTEPAEQTVCTTEEPAETEPAAEPEDEDFVRIADYISNLQVQLAYATEQNFTNTVIYDFTDAYLRYGTVKKLAQAGQMLAEEGYGILIWDAYRPVYAQQRLWDVCPNPVYVSKPGTGSQSHCRGIAVDITLYDLNTGKALEMPTGFDDFSTQADRDYSDCTSEAADNARLLEKVMEECGFKPYSAEWWHFTDTDSYEIEYEFDPAAID